MRASTVVMIGFAVVFGLLAVFLAQTWLSNQAALRAHNETSTPQAARTQTIVVAKQPLRYGAELNAGMLQEVSWAGDAVPDLFRVSTTSTWSPGSTNPPTPSTSLTLMVTAFIPSRTSDDNVARCPGPVIFNESTGSLGSIAASTMRRPPLRTSAIL
jgi:hypothetical protein